ncbi:MAG: 30S ribosomal protein S11 [Rickettsiaceae bacterium]|nr:MAG: 30S ribosomal protein S11 [Rickettsiaceae bacterium]
MNKKNQMINKLEFFEKKREKKTVFFASKMLKISRKFDKYQNSLKKALKFKITKKLRILNKDIINIYVKRNILRRSYFFRILRRSLRKKSILKRITRKKPIITKKQKIDRKFLYRARNSLLRTKKFLYRKQFPKIKGKKNRNFNFMYYNNIQKTTMRFHIGRIVITYLHNNTFINIHDSKKMLKVFSAGVLGFKGPKRSTPYSRQVVARKAVKYLLKTKINILDVYLNSNYNRWYYFLFKEFSKPKIKPYAIRYLISNNPRSHGFLRDKKHRRK